MTILKRITGRTILVVGILFFSHGVHSSDVWAIAVDDDSTRAQRFNKLNPNRIAFKHAHSQGAPETEGEGLSILVSLVVPGKSVPRKTIVDYSIGVADLSGQRIGEIQVSSAIEGYAEVTFATRAGSGDYAVLVANGIELGEVEVGGSDRVGYSVSAQASRTGRNPQTGETIKIPARKMVKFTASIFDKSNGTTRASYSNAMSISSCPGDFN